MFNMRYLSILMMAVAIITAPILAHGGPLLVETVSPALVNSLAQNGTHSQTSISTTTIADKVPRHLSLKQARRKFRVPVAYRGEPLTPRLYGATPVSLKAAVSPGSPSTMVTKIKIVSIATSTSKDSHNPASKRDNDVFGLGPWLTDIPLNLPTEGWVTAVHVSTTSRSSTVLPTVTPVLTTLVTQTKSLPTSSSQSPTPNFIHYGPWWTAISQNFPPPRRAKAKSTAKPSTTGHMSSPGMLVERATATVVRLDEHGHSHLLQTLVTRAASQTAVPTSSVV